MMAFSEGNAMHEQNILNRLHALASTAVEASYTSGARPQAGYERLDSTLSSATAQHSAVIVSLIVGWSG